VYRRFNGFSDGNGTSLAITPVQRLKRRATYIYTWKGYVPMSHGQQRIGFFSIRKHARQMCKYILQFSPVIARIYPDNPALLAALAAASAACEVLVNEIDQVADSGV